MLQFLTKLSERYSIAEEAQMAIEGGCSWIQVTDSLPEGTTLKDVLLEIKPLCEENEAFLVVDSDVDLCQELRIHGVHLHKGDMRPAEARELLGPHAVIGVDVENLDDIMALKGLDIDYAVLQPFGTKLHIEDYQRIISQLRASDILLPIVARGDIFQADIKPLLLAGVNGVALSDAIIDAADPVEMTSLMLNELTSDNQ